MTESEVMYIKSALEKLAEQVDELSKDNRSALGKIYDRLAVLETALSERQKICQYHEAVIAGHEKRLHVLEQHISKLDGVPDRLWKVALNEAQTTAGFSMYLKLGGIAGITGGGVVTAAIFMAKLLKLWPK